MARKISQVGFLFFTLLALLNTSTLAQENSSQVGSVEATVNGKNNQVYQTINQMIINHPGKGKIQRNQRNSSKIKQKSSRSLYHRYSDKIKYPGNHNH